MSRVKSVIVASLTLSGCFMGLNPATAEGVYLDEPIVTKLDWNIRNLLLTDLNGDGLQDVVIVNNDRARIELLYQRKEGEEATATKRRLSRNRWEPELEDSLFRKDSLITGTYVFAVRVGDFDGDGHQDIVYTSNDVPLTIQFGSAEGTYSEPLTYRNFEPLPWVSALQTVALGDRDALVVMGKEKIMRFSEIEREKIEEPLSLRITAENPFGLRVVDLNGDGREDIFYQVGSGEATSARIRLADAMGGFGPELSIPLDVYSVSLEFNERVDGAPLSFYYVKNRTLLLEKASLDFTEKQAEGALERLYTYAFPTISNLGSNVPFVVADFDGDGRDDIVVANSNGAELLFYQQGEHGFSEPVSFPSLSRISGLTVFNDGGKNQLVVLSEVENVVGIALFEDGRFSFPRFLPVDRSPVLVQSVPYNNDIMLAMVVRNDEGQYFLTLKSNLLEKAISTEILIEDMNRAPGGIVVGDINQDGQADILVIGVREPSRIFTMDESGLIAEVAQNSTVRKSLLNNIERSQVAFLDLDQDGMEELVITGNGFARSLILNEQGELVVKDQFNARSAEDGLKVPFLVDIDGDGEKDLLFLHQDGSGIQLLKKDEKGVFRFTRKFEMNNINAGRAHMVTVGGRDEILLPAQNRLIFIRPGVEGLTYESIFTYDSDLEGIKYTGIGLGDLNGDSQPEIIAVDSGANVMDFLVPDEETRLRSVMHFTVFETNIHYQGRQGGKHQPSEWAVGDLNGDGLDDLIISVHDRLLVYPQLEQE